MIQTLPLDLLWLFFFILLSYGAGNALFSLAGFRFKAATDAIFSACLGLSVLIGLTYALARYGLVYRMMFFLIFLALLAFTWKRILQFFKSLKAGLWNFTGFEKALFSVFAAAALFNLAGSYAPPTEGRGLIADLNLPKMIVESHGWNGIAHPIQMLYVMALCVRGVLLANLLHGFLGILSALLIYAGIEFLRSRFGMKPAVYRVILTGLIVPVFAFSVHRTASNLPLLLGRVSREDYLKSKLRFYDVIKFANENLSRNSSVILAGAFDADSFYWNARTQMPDANLLKESDLDALIRRMRALKITHVLIYKDFRGAEDLGWNIPRLEATHFSKNYEDPKVILYRVDYLDNSNKV